MNFNSVTGKNWIFKKFNSADIKKYTEVYSLSETVAKLLSIRKKNIDSLDLYLNPTIKNLLPNPMHLKDMDAALKRTYKSIINGELISIFGDYDVDGASSTAILTKYFLSINQKVKTYIPDRKKDGYGPSINTFGNLIKLGAKILNAVSTNTDYLICGEKPGSKVVKAQNLNIKILSENEWLSMIK